MGENKSYCICRSSDSTRFMIGCDSCNEWYHGDCISITVELSKTISKFYCLMCRDRNPSLKIQYVKDSGSKSSNKQGNVRKKKQPSSRPSKAARIDDDNSSLEKMDFEDEHDEDFDDDDDRDETFRIENELSEKNNRKSKPKSRPSRKKTNTTSTDNKHGTKKTHRQKERDIFEVDDGVRQCYGPGCINTARRGSKYCSDSCGLKLAHDRILEILPKRIQFWQSTPSSADAFSNRELETIRKEGEIAKKVLAELDVKQKELEAMIADAKKLPPISEDEVEETESGDSELMMYCVTCGHEIASRTAMRHMERCFNKFESQISFGGVYKTKVEGVFCDVYNPHQKTYCMRLKVLCPEHTKEQKIPDNEVCGCPLVINCFEKTGQFCRLPKKKCMKHYCWEKLQRAQIDMEKVQKWLKLEELFEKEQKIIKTLSNRGAVLGLMLHSTVLKD